MGGDSGMGSGTGSGMDSGMGSGMGGGSGMGSGMGSGTTGGGMGGSAERYVEGSEKHHHGDGHPEDIVHPGPHETMTAKILDPHLN